MSLLRRKSDTTPAPPTHAYCERVTATPWSPHHIRALTDVGMKGGGGADTVALCGAEVSWDTSAVKATDDVMALSEPREGGTRDASWRACRKCAVAYLEQVAG